MKFFYSFCMVLILSGLCFSQTNLVPVTVKYQCDMKYEILSGRFDPATGYVELRGEVFGWTPSGVKMERDPNNSNVYSYTYVHHISSSGEKLPEFKFWYNSVSNGSQLWEDINNRTYTITDEDFVRQNVTIYRIFNDLSPDKIIKKECKITFQVDLRHGRDLNGRKLPNDIKNIYLRGSASPLSWQGFFDNSKDKMIPMYDNGTNGDLIAGDKIYSVAVVFPPYTSKYIEFADIINYDPSDPNMYFENNSGDNHHIILEDNLKSAMVLYIYGDMNYRSDADIHNLHVKTYYGFPGWPDPIKIKELIQNYPNPFNPSTTINYNIPSECFVKIKIYDIIGNEIQTIVDEYKTKGEYSIQFNGSNLASGIYYLNIQAGNERMTKKIILMK